jgi:Flp pilus assembly protein TadD
MAPADDYAHYALGRCLENLGRTDEARGHYKLASSLRPESEHYRSRIRE